MKRRLLEHVAARRTPVVALCALELSGALCLLLGCLFPMSPDAPVALGFALLPVGLGLAAVTWFAHERLPDGALLGQAALLLVLQGLLVAGAKTAAGVMVDAMGLAWAVAYVALLFPAWSIAAAVGGSAALAGGVLAGGVPGLGTAVAIVVLTMLMVALVLGHVSAVVRRHLATDPLTGALNRAGLQASLPRAHRRGDAAVAVLDLDAFKAVNDDLGHLAGDRLLAEAAAAWRGVLRRDDVLARTGGDEFVVVMPHTSAQEAAAVMRRLRAAHPVAFSAGLTCSRSAAAFAEALERADRDLYAAKAARVVRPVAVAF